MAWRKGTAFRSDPGSGQRIRVNAFRDPIDGADIVQETVLWAGAPAWWCRVGGAEAPAAAREYPYTGGTPTVGSTPSSAAVFATPSTTGATFVRLHTAAMDGGSAAYQGSSAIDPTGLAVVVLDGNARGDIRRITGWHSGSPTSSLKEVDLAAGITASIATTDHYALGFLCEHDTELLIKSEFSRDNIAAPSAQAALVLIDWPRTDANAQRAPIRYVDRILDINNTNVSLDNLNGYHGQTISVPCKGGIVASLVLTSKPANGTIDLWLTSI